MTLGAKKELIATTGARNRGVKKQGLYLDKTKFPADSVEVAFITSTDERVKFLDLEYQDKIAHDLLQGILDYLHTTGQLKEQV